MKKLITNLLALVLVLSLTACGSGASTNNKIKVPESSTDLKGKDYQDVMTLLQVAGFTNIDVEALDDLITGWLTKDGEVEKVSINGETDFSAHSKYPLDAKIVITYHTFPSSATEEVQETAETPEAEKATEVSGVPVGRNVSGFDKKTNQTITWCGIDFSVPSYFDVLDEGSTETWMTYYPKEEDYYASLMFQIQEFSGTDEDFNSQISSIVDSTLDGDFFTNAEILKSNEISIAGLPGWIITFSKSNSNGEGVISTGSYSFAYNVNTGNIVMLSCTYDSNDQSQYDYLGDFAKVLETAILSDDIAYESIYEKGYRVRFQEYDICYLIDEDEKTISTFSTTDYYVQTTTYEGDFNNGIVWDWDGLEMRAHYHYVDQDATLIIYDANGIENKALNLGVDIIEGYLKKYANTN